MARQKTIRLVVKDSTEGEAIARALEDAEMRAFVVLVGTLLPFSDRARRRILTFVADQVADDQSSPSIRRSTPLRLSLQSEGEPG